MYLTVIVSSEGGVIVKCPVCESDSIKCLTDNQLFCLDCDWDNLPELSEIHVSTPCAPFLGGATIIAQPSANVSDSQTARIEVDGVPYGNPIRIEGTAGERSYTIRFSALTVSVEE